MDACYRFLRYCLYLTNFFIFLGGIALIAIGGITLHDQSYFEGIISDSLYTSASYVILGTGIFLVILVFLGSYGAYGEIKCFLLLYVMVLMLFFVILLIGGVLAFVFKNKLSEPLRNEMSRTMMDYQRDEKIKGKWDTIQRLFKCCGIDGPADWIRNVQKTVPESCCRKDTTTLVCQGIPTVENSYQEGCLTKFKSGSGVVGIMGFVVGFFVLLGLILSFAVFKNIPE